MFLDSWISLQTVNWKLVLGFLGLLFGVLGFSAFGLWKWRANRIVPLSIKTGLRSDLFSTPDISEDDLAQSTRSSPAYFYVLLRNGHATEVIDELRWEIHATPVHRTIPPVREELKNDEASAVSLEDGHIVALKRHAQEICEDIVQLKRYSDPAHWHLGYEAVLPDASVLIAIVAHHRAGLHRAPNVTTRTYSEIIPIASENTHRLDGFEVKPLTRRRYWWRRLSAGVLHKIRSLMARSNSRSTALPEWPNQVDDPSTLDVPTARQILKNIYVNYEDMAHRIDHNLDYNFYDGFVKQQFQGLKQLNESTKWDDKDRFRYNDVSTILELLKQAEYLNDSDISDFENLNLDEEEIQARLINPSVDNQYSEVRSAESSPREQDVPKNGPADRTASS